MGEKRSPQYPSANWTWGLGEDGNLYGRGTISGYSYDKSFQLYELIGFGISLGEMKRIVKEFGHLVIFT